MGSISNIAEASCVIYDDNGNNQGNLTWGSAGLVAAQWHSALHTLL